MRKILFLMAIFATMIFTSCEEEKTPKVLSEFIIGTWTNDDIEEFGEDIYVFATFTDLNYYVFGLTDGVDSLILPEANYWVDDELNQVTIEEPDFPDNKKSLKLAFGESEQNTFNVEWDKAVNNVMLWKDLEEDDFWLEWERVID